MTAFTIPFSSSDTNGYRNGLSELLQAYYTFYGAQNGLFELRHRGPTRFAVLKRTLRTSTSLRHVSQCSKRTLQTATTLRHASWGSKRTLRTSTSLLHTLRRSKRTLRTGTSFLHAENGLYELLQSSYLLDFYRPPTLFAALKNGLFKM